MNTINDFGKYLGYLDCCIAAFPVHVHRGNIYSGSGFLPCTVCVQKDPVELIAEIDSRRKHPSVFPFGPELDYMNSAQRAAWFLTLHSELQAAIKGQADGNELRRLSK